MTIYGTTLPGAVSIARWAYKVEVLTPQAKERIKIIDWHRTHGNNISLTSRHFGFTRKIVRKWLRRFAESGVLGLNDHSRRPTHLRQPTTSPEVVVAVVKLRRQYPAWSKYKLRALLARQGMRTSASTIGRILRRRGLIDPKVSRKRKRAVLHPKQRFPKGLVIRNPGDMTQMDTKHITLIGGRKLYQFTAIDVLTKQRIMRYYPSLASRNGAAFLEECLRHFPFTIRAVQTDNGSEFQKEFVGLCETKKIPHYFIYPRTPKQNTYVEISHEADKREWYRFGHIFTDMALMRQELAGWQMIWNTIRPHEALSQLTPQAYYEKWQSGQLPTRDTIILQA